MAPFTLRVTVPAGLKIISSGERVSETQQGDTTVAVYRQTLLAQPMFIARDVQMAAGSDADVEMYVPRDYALTNVKTVERLRNEVRRVAKFYATFFGQPAPRPIRVVASSQIPFYGAPGIIIVDERTFARDVVDEDTVFFIAGNLARSWLSGRNSIQGAGNGVLLDGLPSYLALLYLQEQYGKQVVDRTVERFRNDYSRIVSGVSAYDAPLVRQSLLNREYYTSVFNKVPLVMRLIERSVGRDKLTGVIKAFFSGTANQPRTLEGLRDTLMSAGDSARLKTLFENWFDRIVLPDLAVGKPVLENGQWSVNVANFGDGAGDVDVEIVLSSGEKRRQTVRFEAEGYAKALFDVPSEPVLARIDPDQHYLQARYDNDAFPRKPAVNQLIGQGTLALVQGKAAEAEPKARQAVEAEPENAVAHSVLARVLAALGRLDEAEREAQAALKQSLPSLTAYANAQWAMGDIGMKRQQAAQAVTAFRQAALASAEDTSLLTARESLIQAERAANQLMKADESIQSFMTQFDAAVSTGTPAAVRGLVEQANLKAFTIGVSFIKAWKSEILRAERLDAHRMTLDVQAQAVTGEKQRTVKAIFTLRKQPEGWRVYDIPVFVEK
jgi:tetratricopeptide (TPR) repeat protein